MDDHYWNINFLKVTDLHHSSNCYSEEKNRRVKMKSFVLIGFVESWKGTVNSRTIILSKSPFRNLKNGRCYRRINEMRSYGTFSILDL